MNESKIETNQKIKNNAIISYLFIIINFLFLSNKTNSNINNVFVKNHTKTAIFIHFLFLINTIVFVKFWLWFYYEILWYSIDDIIAISIYLILLVFLTIGIYKAYSWEEYKTATIINFKNYDNKKIIDINSDGNFWEKDKLTILLSRIPFLWFIIFPKYKNRDLIKNINKLNVIFSLIFILLYIFWNTNLANLLLLIYIIFIVFSTINLYINNKIINLNLESIPSLKLIIFYIKIINIYLWNYFGWDKKEFNSFSNILEKELKEKNNKSLIIEKELREKNNFKLPEIIIYTPIINIITIFNINTKQKKHIINWLLITFSLIILFFNYDFYNNYQLLLLFPILFWYWYLKAWIYNYEFPILYDLYKILELISDKFIILKNKIKKIKNTEKSVNLKINEKQKNWN